MKDLDDLFDTDPAMAKWLRNRELRKKIGQREARWAHVKHWSPVLITLAIFAAVLAAAASEILPLL
jgi:hypothetical protein